MIANELLEEALKGGEQLAVSAQTLAKAYDVLSRKGQEKREAIELVLEDMVRLTKIKKWQQHLRLLCGQCARIERGEVIFTIS